MGKNPFHSLSAKFTQLFLDGQADQTPLQPETKEDTYQFISAGSFHTAATPLPGETINAASWATERTTQPLCRVKSYVRVKPKF